MKTKETYTKEETENSTDVYDALDPTIKIKVKEPSTWNKFLKLVQEFMNKNSNSLQTNILGRRVLLNPKMEDDVFEIFGLKKQDVKKAILESTYFKGTFGREISLTDQLCLAFPLILASLEYKNLGKQDESDLCYLFTHFKPYSSRESLFFKFGVKEGQMLYTVEKALSERFDIKKYGTILAALRKRAQSSYENYIADMEKNEKMTDKKLYITYTSGIAGSVNTFIGTIVEVYRKCEGKNLEFEDAAQAVFDKDSDSTDYEDKDIQSDEAIKTQSISKVLLAITKNPLNRTLCSAAASFGFESSSRMYSELLAQTIEEIIDKDFNILRDFFSGIINSFLFHQKPGSSEKYTMVDYKSPIFLSVGIDILAGKKSNVRDVNLLRCREIFKKMLSDHSEEYNEKYGDTYKRKFEKALAAYWIYLIKTYG